MSGENNIEFKSEPDNRPNDLLAKEAGSNPRDPARSPESVEAVRTVASQAPQSTENPLAPQSTQIPALPVLSFFGATEAVTPDTVKGMFMDAMKNVTINGVSPNINGGSIDFNVETKSSASQQWNSVNGINIPAIPLAPAPPSNYPTGADSTANQPAPPTNQQTTPQGQASKVETPEIDLSMFSMAKPKTLKERARELEEERDADSEVFSMAKPKSLKVASSRNTIDDVIDQAESESKAVSGGERRRSKDRIFDRIEEAIENEDYDKARKLNEQVKNRELETELRGEGKDRDRRSTKDIAEAEGIDTSGKSNKELRQEILEKRRDAQEKADTRPTTEIQSIEVGKEVVQIIPVPVKRADDTDYRMIYVMAKSAVNLETDKSPPETLESPDNDDSFTNQEYWVPLGGGSGGNHPFKVSVKSGTDSSYKVFLRSSIINGTNGGPFTISGLNVDKPLSTEKFIIAEADVTSNPFKISDSGFTIKEVDAADTDEVKLEDNKQTKIRLLIAKITVEDIEGGGKALTAWQAITTSFRTAVSFHNGVPVYVLQAAPTHQSSI